MGIATQHLLDLESQAGEALPHIRVARRQPDPNPARNRNHRRRLDSPPAIAMTRSVGVSPGNRTARNRHQAARARNDMRTWQVERRKRTRHLIELGGLNVKSGVVDLTGDNRAVILGALIWAVLPIVRVRQLRRVTVRLNEN